MTTDRLIPFPEPAPTRGPDLEALSIDAPEWSRGTVHLHHFRPLDVSAADRFVGERIVRPGHAVRRALDDQVSRLLDVAATTWNPRRVARAGYGIGSFEARREARRRSALAAELRALRAAHRATR